MRAASVTIHRVRTGKGSAYEAFSSATYGTGTHRFYTPEGARALLEAATALKGMSAMNCAIDSLDY